MRLEQRLFDAEARMSSNSFSTGDIVIKVLKELLQATTEALHEELTSVCSDTNDILSHRIASFVRNVAMTHLNARHVLLVHLAQIVDPLPFIEILSSLFSVATTPQLIEDLVSQLKTLLESNHNLLLPIIGTLVDLPIPPHIAPELAQLAESAISIVDEEDLPVLFRTLLKSLGTLSVSSDVSIAQRLRKEIRSLSDDTIALVVEAMWEVLPSSPRASNIFLEQIMREEETERVAGRRVEPQLADVAVILILAAETGALKVRSRRLLEGWLQHGIFPFCQLELILGLRRANEVWDRMVPSVWRLALWLLDSLSEDVEAPSSAENYRASKVALCSLVISMYEKVPFMKETVLSGLLQRSLAPCRHPSHARGNGEAALEALSSLGRASEALGMFKRSAHEADGEGHESQQRDALASSSAALQRMKRERDLETHRALLAAITLERLVVAHEEVGAFVLSALSDRLQQAPSGGALLPPPTVLHCLVMGVVKGAAASSQSESTLLIVIQKLLSSVTLPDMPLLRLLGMVNHDTRTVSLGAAEAQARHEGGAYFSSHYSHMSVGLMLATCFLEQPGVHGEDAKAVLTWVERALPSLRDHSLVLALDLLDSALERQEEKPIQLSLSSSSSSSSSSHSDSHDVTSPAVRDAFRPHVLRLTAKTLDYVLKSFSVGHVLVDGTSLPPFLSKTNVTRDTGLPFALYDCSQPHPAQTSQALKGAVAATQTQKGDDTPEGRSIKDVGAELAVVWCVARASAAIVALLPGDEPGYEATSFVKLAHDANAMFWSYQMAASLHAQTHTEPKANKTTLTGLQLSHSPHLLAEGAAPKSRGRKGEPYRGDISGLVASGAHLWSWASPANESYSAVFVRPAGMDIETALRLAWERALAVGVLSGQLKATKVGEDEENGVLAQLSRLLAQMNNCRLLLRAVQANTLPVEKGTRELSNRKPELGAHRPHDRGHQLISGSAWAGGEVGRGAERSKEAGLGGSPDTRAVQGLSFKYAEVLAVHRDTLHDLLNRTVCLLDVRSVAHGLQSVLEEDKQLQTDHTIAHEPPQALLSDVGLALTGTFVLHMLHHDHQGRGESSADHLSTYHKLRLSTDQTFVTFDELRGSKCSSTSDKDGLESLEKAARGLLACIPGLAVHIEQLRRKDVVDFSEPRSAAKKSQSRDKGKDRSGENGRSRRGAKRKASAQQDEVEEEKEEEEEEGGAEATTTTHPMLGSPLDRHGCSVLLVQALLLAETVVKRAQREARGNIDDFAREALFSKAAQDLVSAANKLPSLGHIEESSGLGFAENKEESSAGDPEVSDQHVLAAVGLYRVLERRIRAGQDSTLSIAGLRLVAAVSKGTALHTRTCSLAWSMIRAVYTTHTDMSAQLMGPSVGARGVPGMDALWPHLMCYLERPSCFSLAVEEVGMLGGGRGKPHGSRARATRSCETLLKAAFNPSIASVGAASWAQSGGRSGLMLSDESHAMAAIRNSMNMWWVHELRSLRVFGLAALIQETMRRYFSPVDRAEGIAQLSGVGEPGEPGAGLLPPALPQEGLFRGMTELHADRYLASALSLLPAALLSSKPGPSSTLASACSPGPYSELINACKTFLWTTRELELIAAEGEHIGLCMRISPLCVRVCRAHLEALEVGLGEAVAWRTEQRGGLTPGMDQEKEGDDGDDEEDPGDLRHLEELLQWALAVSHGILRYALSLRSRLLLKGHLAAPKGISRSLPQLQLLAEKFSSLLHRLATSHSIALADAGLFADMMWERTLISSAHAFVRKHELVLETEATVDSWIIHDGGAEGGEGMAGLTEAADDWAAQEASAAEGWQAYYDKLAEQGFEEGSFAALASHEGMGAEGAGWGLYDQGDYSDEGEGEEDYDTHSWYT